MPHRKIAIIGGGIAGLAFAIRYRQLGGELAIYERSVGNSRDGLGFILLKNGMQALEKLGLGLAMSKVGQALDECHIHDELGNSLTKEYLPGAYGLARKAFVDVLRAHVPPDWIHYGEQFSHFEYYADGCASAAVCKDATYIEADFFLGCDGAHSRVRHEIVPEATHSNARVHELVSMIKSPSLVKKMGHQFTKYRLKRGGLALGLVPVNAESLIWFLQYAADEYHLTNTSCDGKRKFARQLMLHWPEKLTELIEETDFNRTHIWKNCYLNPLEQFYKNNIVLLGDAAHAMLTFTSQGINSAIEDAVMLAELITCVPKGAENFTLQRYSLARKQAILPLLQQGIELQDEFMENHNENQKIPFAF